MFNETIPDKLPEGMKFDTDFVYSVKELRKLYKEFQKCWHVECTTECLDFFKWLKKGEKK